MANMHAVCILWELDLNPAVTVLDRALMDIPVLSDTVWVSVDAGSKGAELNSIWFHGGCVSPLDAR